MIPVTQIEAIVRASWDSTAVLDGRIPATDSRILTSTTHLRANAERGPTAAIRRLCQGACARHDIEYRRAVQIAPGFTLEPGESA